MAASFARLASISTLLLVGLLHAPRADAQCEHLARQLIGADLGGPRIYAPTVTPTIGMPTNPAVAAGVDALVGTGPGLPNETAQVHWYRDHIVAIVLKWEPKTDSELKPSIAKLAALTDTPRLFEINQGPLTIPCGSEIEATITRSPMAKGGTVMDRPPLQLSLIDKQGYAAMRTALDTAKTKH
jgi:hypothetical protein